MLKKIIKIELNVKLLTGLYIGGADTGFDIGGADSNVIKNPLNNEPYIPGSSLKGKLKYLLKVTKGRIDLDQNDYVFDDANIAIIFGDKNKIEDKENQQTRGIFRDLTLTNKDLLEEKLGKGQFTEVKAENSIDALSSKAANPRFIENSIDALSSKAANPRFIERVPAGAEFGGEIDLNVFDEDDEKAMVKALEESLKLLEYNYLGGSGTRGYGRVKVDYKVEDVNL